MGDSLHLVNPRQTTLNGTSTISRTFFKRVTLLYVPVKHTHADPLYISSKLF